MKIIITLYILLNATCIYSQEIEKVSITVHDIKGYGEYEEFAMESIQKLEDLLNSSEFETEFIKRKMKQTKGKNKKELLNLIYTANELRGNSHIDNTIDLRLRVMSYEEDGNKWMKNCELDSSTGTIGKEADKSGYTITCYERIELWAKNKNYGCMAGHIMHEYLHNLGLKHRLIFKYKSVVYQSGYLVQELIDGNKDGCPIN